MAWTAQGQHDEAMKAYNALEEQLEIYKRSCAVLRADNRRLTDEIKRLEEHNRNVLLQAVALHEQIVEMKKGKNALHS